MEFINPHPDVKPVGPYGVRVKTGQMIFVEGQVAYNEKGDFIGQGDVVAQTRQAMKNIEKVLSLAGAKWTDVVKLNTYVTDNSSWQDVRQARLEILGKHRPASTLVTVAALAEAMIMVEIEAIAVI